MEVNNISLQRLASYYFICSYLYYEKDVSIVDDAQFDYICKRLLEDFNIIKHPHKHLLDKVLLKCGSGFDLQYNDRIINSAKHLEREYGKKR